MSAGDPMSFEYGNDTGTSSGGSKWVDTTTSIKYDGWPEIKTIKGPSPPAAPFLYPPTSPQTAKAKPEVPEAPLRKATRLIKQEKEIFAGVKVEDYEIAAGHLLIRVEDIEKSVSRYSSARVLLSGVEDYEVGDEMIIRFDDDDVFYLRQDMERCEPFNVILTNLDCILFRKKRGVEND